MGLNNAGTYTLNAGTLNGAGGAVGVDGAGTFNQTGGYANESWTVGARAPGTYNLSGGTTSFNQIGNQEGGVGIINQTGGAATGADVWLGFGTGGPDQGTYNLTGNGTLAVGSLILGGSFYTWAGGGAGVVNQSTGTISATTLVSLGYSAAGSPSTFYPTGTGLYNLSGGNFSTPALYVGGSDTQSGGIGTYSQSGGTANVGSITIWNSQSSVSLNGGTLNVGSISNSGGTFNFNGGTLNLTSSDLAVTASGLLGGSITLGSSKALSVSGTTTIDSDGTLIINGGTFTTGAFSNSSGGTFEYVTGSVNVLNDPGFLSTILGSNPTLTSGQNVSTSGSLTTQSGSTTTVAGGSVAVAGNLDVSSSTLSVSSGSASAATISLATGSTAVISGGTVTTQSIASSNSTIQISGTANVSVTNAGSFALTGTSSVQQSGSSVATVAGPLVIAPTAGDQASYTLSQGSLTGQQGVLVGPSGTGSFTQTGGTSNFSGVFGVGNDGNLTSGTGTGIANFSGGTGYAPTVLLGSTAGGHGDMTISGTAVFTCGGGAHVNDLTVANGGTFIVLDQTPPVGEDPELNRAIVGGYLTDGQLNVGANAYVSAPYVKLGITSGNTGTLTQTGGSITLSTLSVGNDGTLTSGSGSGVANISGGSLFAGTVLLGSTAGGSGAMTVSGSGNVTVAGGAHVNDLTVSGGTFTVQDGTAPAGEDPELADAIVGGYLTNGALNVSGTGVVSSPLLKLGITSGDTGTLSQSGGSVTLSTLGVGNDGTLTSGSGTGVANISGGSLYADTILLGSTAGGSGAMTVSGSGNVTVGGGAHVNDLTINSGTFTVLDQDPVAGEDPVLNRSIVGGYLSNGAMYLNGGVVSTPNLKMGIDHRGTFVQNGGTISITTNLLANQGSNSIVTLNGGTMHLYAATIATGSPLVVGDGTHAFDLNLTGGTVNAADGVTISASGTLNGNGTINGNVTNNGVVSPGNSPGTINITGNLINTGVLQMQLASATSFDQLNVTGSVTLAGTIALSSLDGYVPAPNATFQIFNFGSMINSGITLDTSGLDLPAGETLNASTFASTGEFSVTPEPGGLSLIALGGITLMRRRRRAILGVSKEFGHRQHE